MAFANDSLAGLARCTLSSRGALEALPLTSELWNYLCQHGSQGMEFPVMAFITCAQVYKTVGDEEKYKLALQAGYDDLIGRADKISDQTWRATFLNNIPEHQKIVSLWKKSFL